MCVSDGGDPYSPFAVKGRIRTDGGGAGWPYGYITAACGLEDLPPCWTTRSTTNSPARPDEELIAQGRKDEQLITDTMERGN